jgi:Ribbon-helix-helix protein, copG family
MMKRSTLQIRLEPDLTRLIENAVQRTGLSKSEVLRQGLRKGIPAVVDALEGPPRKTLVDALFALKGLEIPPRRHRMKRRI